MHELSLTQSIVEMVDEAARAQRAVRVERVRLVVGAQSSVEPEALRFCFDVVAASTLAAGARLEIVVEDGFGVRVDEMDVVDAMEAV